VSDDDELLERFRAANPVRASTPRQSAEADALLERVLTTRPRPRHRTIVVMIVLAVTFAGLALGGFVWLRHAGGRERAQAVCFEADDVRAHTQLVVSNGDAIDACAALWRAGRFGSQLPSHLAACVLKTGGIAVFPGEAGTTCVRLGLAVANDEAHSAIAQMTADLTHAVTLRCYDASASEALARSALQAHHLEGWNVVIGRDPPFSATNPCGSVAVREVARTILIVAVPDLQPDSPSG